jgi:hypothetical protein
MAFDTNLTPTQRAQAKKEAARCDLGGLVVSASAFTVVQVSMPHSAVPPLVFQGLG